MLGIKDILAECLNFAEDNDIIFYYSAIGSQFRFVKLFNENIPVSVKACLAARLFLKTKSE